MRKAINPLGVASAIVVMKLLYVNQILYLGTQHPVGALEKMNAVRTHEMSKTRLYHTWQHMKDRCYNAHSEFYYNYGGRGISVCKEWKDNFCIFRDWAMANGYTDKLTIDRIDVNGNYEPSNCRWVSMKTQSQNRRNTIMAEYNGENILLTDIAKACGVKYGTLIYRYRKGKRNDDLYASV